MNQGENKGGNSGANEPRPHIVDTNDNQGKIHSGANPPPAPVSRPQPADTAPANDE